ncbi:hypothetical protein MASR2M54_09060 [Aliarcobacter cryaerophilus]
MKSNFVSFISGSEGTFSVLFSFVLAELSIGGEDSVGSLLSSLLKINIVAKIIKKSSKTPIVINKTLFIRRVLSF